MKRRLSLKRAWSMKRGFPWEMVGASQAKHRTHSQTFTTWGLRQNRCLNHEMKDIFCLFVAMASSKAFPEALKYEEETQFFV